MPSFSLMPDACMCCRLIQAVCLLLATTMKSLAGCQVQQAVSPPAASPLINGTYLILNVASSIACSGGQGLPAAQYLSRGSSNCQPQANLSTAPLSAANALEVKWEIKQAPGASQYDMVWQGLLHRCLCRVGCWREACDPLRGILPSAPQCTACGQGCAYKFLNGVCSVSSATGPNPFAYCQSLFSPLVSTLLNLSALPSDAMCEVMQALPRRPVAQGCIKKMLIWLALLRRLSQQLLHVHTHQGSAGLRFSVCQPRQLFSGPRR